MFWTQFSAWRWHFLEIDHHSEWKSKWMSSWKDAKFSDDPHWNAYLNNWYFCKKNPSSVTLQEEMPQPFKVLSHWVSTFSSVINSFDFCSCVMSIVAQKHMVPNQSLMKIQMQSQTQTLNVNGPLLFLCKSQSFPFLFSKFMDTLMAFIALSVASLVSEQFALVYFVM